MSVPPPGEGGESTGPYSPAEILRIHGQITLVCLFEGLNSQDTKEIAQNIWVTLLEKGLPGEAPAAARIRSFTRNFILRHRRQRRRLRFRETISLEDVPESSQPRVAPASVDSKVDLDRVRASLPEKEGRLLDLIRRGHKLWAAEALLEIPEGSRAYVAKRLVELARRKLGTGNLSLPTARTHFHRTARGTPKNPAARAKEEHRDGFDPTGRER